MVEAKIDEWKEELSEKLNSLRLEENESKARDKVIEYQKNCNKCNRMVIQ